MGTTTGAHLLVRAIRQHGIERIFGPCGDHVNSIFSARIDEGVATVDTRQHVETPPALRRALARAFKSGKVACVNVMIRGVASPLTTTSIARAKAAPL